MVGRIIWKQAVGVHRDCGQTVRYTSIPATLTDPPEQKLECEAHGFVDWEDVNQWDDDLWGVE